VVWCACPADRTGAQDIDRHVRQRDVRRADIGSGTAASLASPVHGSPRWAAAVSAGDLVVDLRGDRLASRSHQRARSSPSEHAAAAGINGPLRHAREWVSQVNVRRRTDPAFESRVTAALDERLLIGGVKNLLSGVTTVAHHDPLYPFWWASVPDVRPHQLWLVAFPVHRWRRAGTQCLFAYAVGLALDHSCAEAWMRKRG